jgi:hypothetical protein
VTPRKVSKAIFGAQLEEYTRQGWVIKSRYKDSFASTMPTQVPVPSNNGSYPTTMSGSEAVVTSTTYFVVERDEEVVVREEQLQAEVARLLTETRDLKNALDKAAITTSNAEAKAQRAAETVAGASQELRDNATRISALEGQLAKVRRAIGEIQYKEILGLA